MQRAILAAVIALAAVPAGTQEGLDTLSDADRSNLERAALAACKDAIRLANGLPRPVEVLSEWSGVRRVNSGHLVPGVSSYAYVRYLIVGQQGTALCILSYFGDGVPSLIDFELDGAKVSDEVRLRVSSQLSVGKLD